MEIELEDSRQAPPRVGTPTHRAKSSLRLKYEAEAQVLRARLGDLESIREKLGLSQRKICQLLLVDPSAWTRWTRSGEVAPPHVYRMLQWYLALNDKYPALDAAFWLSTVSRDTLTTDRERANQLDNALNGEIQNLSSNLHSAKLELIAKFDSRFEAAGRDIFELQEKIRQFRRIQRFAVLLAVILLLALGAACFALKL
jgi:transcriptional regulator with XRE-family HTH domain